MANFTLHIPCKNDKLFDENSYMKKLTCSEKYNASPNVYAHATHYSYDIHGNVKSLLQDNSQLSIINNQFKRIDYTYDLISGNVHKVDYQNGEPDQWTHKYDYDADNRIKSVKTSSAPLPSADGAGGGVDAKYFYYAHGPLARVELGNDKVQGMDYAYTLQGWIKGVNSETLLPKNDIGKDADVGVNKNFARDAFGYSLGYFDSDYTSIKNISPADYFLAKKTGSGFFADRNNLFNGNISAMVTTLTNPNGNITIAQGTAYKYDQLNRIMKMRAHRNLDFFTNEWGILSGDDGSYAEDYTYNANGSILSLKRNGLANIANGDMDNLTYIYETTANNYARNTNKLRQIKDAVAPNTYTDDMDDQVQDNYEYDEIGNLIKDDFECIQKIEWTNFGKVKKVTRTPGCLTEGIAMPDLEFNYDATGNVIAKIVKPAGQINNPAAWETTYYVKDAQGNIMATYEQKNDPITQTASYKLTEKQLYGSAHIGTEKTEIEMLGAQPPSAANFSHTLGKKHFFLTDHRGNNNVTVSDKKIPIQDLSNPAFVLYFEPDIIRAVDYYPFGREMNGREFNRDASEFGYNGKQNIKEWSVRKGGAQLQGARIKYGEGFLSLDQLARKYSNLSPYIFAGNSPIQAMDIDGKLIIFINGYYGFPTQAHSGGQKAYWGESWVNEVKRNLGDQKAYYFDGSLGGSNQLSSIISNPALSSVNKSMRMFVGYMEGKQNARTILDNLDAGETVKFITSSMGAPYQRGFSQALVEEADAMNQEIDSYNEMAKAFNANLEKMTADMSADGAKDLMKLTLPLKQRIDLKIDFTLDLDPFQGSELPVDKNATKSLFTLNAGTKIMSKIERILVGSAVPGARPFAKNQMLGHHPSTLPPMEFIELMGTGGSAVKKDIEQDPTTRELKEKK